jgi:hypothetical protein
MSSATVTVYAYSYYDRLAEGFLISTRKAPKSLIRERGLGDPLEPTAEDVLSSELGPDGCYQRQATGWGDLN